MCFQIVDTVVSHEFLYKSGQEMVRAPSGVKGSNQIFESWYPLPPKTPFSVSAWMKLDLLPRDTFLDPRMRDFPQRCIDTNDDG